MKKRAILFLISFSLIAALVYISNPSEIASILSGASLKYVGLALFFWFVGSLVRTGRWSYLLRRTGIVASFGDLWKYYVSGMALSNFSPGKTADPVRAVFLKKLDGESFSKGLGSVMAERIFDIVTLALISLISLSWLATSSSIIRWVYVSIGVYAFVILFGLYLVFSEGKLEWFLNKVVSIFSFIPGVSKLEEKIEGFCGKLKESLGNYGSFRTVLKSLFFSFLVWVTNALLVKMVFNALGLQASVVVVLGVYCTAVLLGLLTFLPGALGSSEVIQVSLYGALIPYGASALTSAVLLTRFTNFFVYAVIGALILSTMPKELVEI
ncbi:MAG: lysylphosphatidylglycerol synthase transmembrane domain-containing protein [Candidatus Aenigmatarchaeota archaeon]